MSTFTDGAPPLVTPDPDDSRPEPGDGGEPGDGSAWLREEMARRLIATSDSGSGGRHARRNNGSAVEITGRTPRHAAAPPGSARPAGAPALPPRLPRRDILGDRRRFDFPRFDPRRFDSPSRDPRQDHPDPWTGPGPAERGPAAPGGPGTPSLPMAGGSSARIQPPQAQPSHAPHRPPRSSPQPGIGTPSRPAPPSGPAAARLLSPPAEPPQAAPVPPPPAAVLPSVAVPPGAASPLAAPTLSPPPVATPRPSPRHPLTPPAGGLAPNGFRPAAERSVEVSSHDTLSPVIRRPDPGPPTGPVWGGPADDETEDEILWSADAMPPPKKPFAVPQPRTPDPADEPPLFPRPDDAEDAEASVRRVRVVLAERKGVARPVRTVVDIQEGTAVGELLRTNLIGSQLRVALRFAALAALTLGSLPLLFALFPVIGEIEIPFLRLRLPWLLLGFLVYPFLLGLGWWHTRTAERVEQTFADHVQE